MNHRGSRTISRNDAVGLSKTRYHLLKPIINNINIKKKREIDINNIKRRKEINNFKPTNSQELAINEVRNWLDSPTKPFWISGLAGTGKSTIIPMIIKALNFSDHDYVICAPSNKAVSVLRTKGFNNALTVAKIARTAKVSGPQANRFRQLNKQLKNISSLSSQEIKSINKELSELRGNGEVYWTHSSNTADKCKVIIVDEASMLSNKDAKALIDSQSPILLIGDYGQLLSVNTSGNKEDSSYLEKKKPDVELTEIMRQQFLGNIIQASRLVRKSPKYLFSDLTPEIEKEKNGEVIFKTTNLTKELIEEHKIQQVLAYSNNVCFNHIAKVRKDKPSTPIAGDRLLAYSTSGPVIKGQIYEVMDCSDNKNGLLAILLRDETGLEEMLIDTLVPKELFLKSHSNKQRLQLLGNANSNKSVPGAEALNYMYFADCITIHKSQGSEWDNVAVYLPKSSFYVNIPDDSLSRLKYTAITRAKKKLIVVI